MIGLQTTRCAEPLPTPSVAAVTLGNGQAQACVVTLRHMRQGGLREAIRLRASLRFTSHWKTR